MNLKSRSRIGKRTTTVVLAPIIKALMCVEDRVEGVHGNWAPQNEWQRIFLQRFYSHRQELLAFGPEELKAWVADNAAELNNVLAEHGYDIRLDDWADGEGSFGVVAIMDAIARWVTPGKREDIYCQLTGETYPGVKLKGAFCFSSSAHHSPILGIQAQDNYEVWMTVGPEPFSDVVLVDNIQSIRESIVLEDTEVDVHFPMINFDHEADLSWLINLSAVGNDTRQPVVIRQAKQQTRFRMNEFGARAQSAVAVATSRGIGPKTLVIDEPFYLWILKDLGDGGPKMDKIPVFAGYFDVDAWDDPGSID